MKRTLLTILLFLLLGAVANVAVAWGCAAGSDWAVAYTRASMNESEWGRHSAQAAFLGDSRRIPGDQSPHAAPGLVYCSSGRVGQAMWDLVHGSFGRPRPSCLWACSNPQRRTGLAVRAPKISRRLLGAVWSAPLASFGQRPVLRHMTACNAPQGV